MIPALVVGLSFAAGLNTYATLLALGVMARLHWLALPAGLGAVGDTWLIVVCVALFLGEFVADKIPGFDVIWNLLHTFIRVPAAALLAFSAASPLPGGMQVAVTVLGAAVAAVAHGSKTVARVAVTPSPEPFSNAALSLGEDGAAVGLSWVAVHHPLVGAAAVGAAMAVAAAGVWLGLRWVRAGWDRMFRDRRRMGYRSPLKGKGGELLPEGGVDGNA